MTAPTPKLQQEHLLIVDDARGRRSVPLLTESYLIGRDRSCDIHLSSQFVSRHHAVLNRKTRSDGTVLYQIVDGDTKGRPSVNGLLINGKKLSTHNLQHGDEVVFGPQVSAIYQSRIFPAQTNADHLPAMSPEDPFDITLIDPAMMSGDTETAKHQDDIPLDPEQDTASNRKDV
ncbi:FHA domain-containing protein [Spirulina major CS-329]|uniref:FHA domain-containing protein n=1 Tax=Spirulina TaxID=1154 RepID=UPI00232EC112|nr:MULTISPECIES: FHA domain-containing protein [Spirulina]MDB9493941.1 FHA domain-containing protein [Spirulina subsalsa CS-330]MDB9503700.1 FHA domain-containing protein [Spirulina major CS-329]